MIISPFTPLLFSNHRHDGIDSCYIQTFAPSDQILIEMLCSVEDGPYEWTLFSEPDHKPIYSIEPSIWQINTTNKLLFAVLSPSPGYYSVAIAGMNSNIFRVTNDNVLLGKTTLIQYSMNSNRHRKDAVFFIDGMQRFFDFRVPGGFKDSNWAFAVESEQFTTDQADIVQLYGLESTQKKFTLGNSDGCPVWFAEMLNRVLCCSYVYFDGERYARKETSAPEMTVLLEGLNSFVFTQTLQQVAHIDPQLTLQHQAIMRRLEDDNYRLATNDNNRLIF